MTSALQFRLLKAHFSQWLLSCFLLCASTSFAQPGIEWSRLYSTILDDRFTSILATPDGGYVAAGEFAAFPPSGNIGYADLRVIKISADGSVEWEKILEADYLDQDPRIVQAPDGGYLVAGTSQSGQSGDKSENDRGKSDSDRGDFWVIKLAANGAKQWEKTIGGDRPEYLKAVAVTSDGGYLLGGSSSSDISGEKTSASRGGSDFWLVKINAAGAVQWDRSYGGSGSDALQAMKILPDGIILGGSSDSQAGSDKSQNAVGFRDYWLVRLSPDGNKLWDKTIGGPYDEVFTNLELTKDGGYVLCGSSTSGIGGDKTQAGHGAQDYWIVKTDALGQITWNKSIGGSQYEVPYTVVQTPDGGYVVGGYSASRNDGNKWEPRKGGYSVWIIKLNAVGKKIWEKSLGSTGQYDYSVSSDLIVRSDGSYLMAGQVRSGSGTGDVIQASRGADSWIVKLQADGNFRKVQLSADSVYLGATSFNPVTEQILTLASPIPAPFVIQTQERNWLNVMINGSNVRFTANATGLSPGVYNAAVTINAVGYARAVIPVTFVVRVAPAIADIPDITIPGNQTASFTASASVNPGERVIFSLVNPPAGALIDTLGRFIWTPQVPGVYTVRVRASTTVPPILTSDRDVRVTVTQGYPEDVIRINAGAGDYTTADGRFFQADQLYTGGDISAREVGDIQNTVDDELYRIARAGESFNYAVPVRNGIYKVIMHFAETYWGVYPGRPGYGNRVFEIKTEATSQDRFFDIYGNARGALKALQQTYEVPVQDGVLNLNFIAEKDQARLSALEIIFVSPLQGITLNPIADAYVRGGTYANQNFGSEAGLDIKGGSREDLNRATYMKFSLQGITQVNEAKLRIYGYKYETDTEYAVVNLDIHTLDNNNWDENTITWNKVPTGTLKEIIIFSVYGEARYFEFDVTKFARSWVKNADKTVTLLLRDNGRRKSRVIFNSKENAVNQPELIIYTTAPVINGARLVEKQEIPGNNQQQQASYIYPNPVKNRISIHVSERHTGDVALQLSNASGVSYPVTSRNRITPDRKVETDISQLYLSPGLYWLKLASAGHTEVLKVLVGE